MDEESRIVGFIKQNKLIVGFVAIGFLCVVVGGIQYFGKQSSDISIQKAPEVEAAATSSASLVVDIEGEVIKPGVYKLPADSRVQDIVTAAGGFSSTADKTYISQSINLAQKLVDGAKLYIPKVGESPQSGTAPSGTMSSSGSINVNAASEQDLDSLPGVGAVTAGKIIAGRPYSDLNELVSRKIVSQKVFDEIKAQISLF